MREGYAGLGWYLEQGMASDDAEETLETFSPGLDDLVGEAICEDLAWESGDVDTGGLVLEDVTEGLKVGVSPADERVAQFECRDVGLYNTQGVMSLTIAR